MPQIISSTKLRNEYNEVSRMAHANLTPIFVTKNGVGDLAVMSMEAYDSLTGRAELRQALEKGHADVEAGRTVDAFDALSQLRHEYE